MSDLNSINSYLDFTGLSNLRAKAKDDQASAAKEVGRQFEAMFVQMMMKSVRQANETIKSDLMGSSAVDTFEEMYHNELSQVMASNDAFGISDWLVQHVNNQSVQSSRPTKFDIEKSVEFPLETNQGNIEEML
jgi:Rod binding domain-containing protein